VQENHAQMLAVVRQWPHELYHVPTVIAAVQRRAASARAEGEPDAPLQEVLGELYMADGQRERAVAIYLQLQRPGLFDFIHQVCVCVVRTSFRLALTAHFSMRSSREVACGSILVGV